MFGHNYEAESWLEWPMLLAVSLLISPMISFIPLFLFLGLFEMTWHGVSSVLGLKVEPHEDRWQVVCVAIIAMGLFFQFYMEITHIFPNFFTMYPFSR